MQSLTDRDILALTLYGEVANQPIDGKCAVANVIRNRIALQRWGDTYTSVCRAPMQFSCWNPGSDENHTRLMALAGQVQAGLPVTDPTLVECYWIADGCIGKKLQDNTDGATYYFVASMVPWPSWAQGKQPIARIGSHLFFKNIA